MLFTSPRRLIGFGCAFAMFLPLALQPLTAEAQIVRRFGGGRGIQVNAPYVRVNVGRGGTSVQAPFTSVNAAGRPFIGRRRRALAAQQPQAAPARSAYRAQQPVARQPQQAATPELATAADVDSLPYPSTDQLAGMEDQALVETLRDMMSRLEQRLSRLKTGAGWQRHLVLGSDILGEPGTPADAVQISALQNALPRYQSVADEPKFAKISTLPSFIAVHAALGEAISRFASAEEEQQLELGNPNGQEQHQAPAIEPDSNPILPTPEPVAMPNATRGERSILKRK